MTEAGPPLLAAIGAEKKAVLSLSVERSKSR